MSYWPVAVCGCSRFMTWVRSRPVRVLTAGGMLPASRAMSPVAPVSPTSTISSVLAKGADTSAAIWKCLLLVVIYSLIPALRHALGGEPVLMYKLCPTFNILLTYSKKEEVLNMMFIIFLGMFGHKAVIHRRIRKIRISSKS